MRQDIILQKLDFINKHKHVLEPVVLERMEEGFDLDFTYNSTTIEGNTLSKMEMKLLLEDNISVGGKELREIYEVTNHKKAFDYVKNCIDRKEPLSENKIKDIHEILTENIFNGGVYRNHDNSITSANFATPTPNDMFNQLRFFYADLEKNKETMNSIELSAWTHAEFVRIHPFPDGNGRISRLIMNYQLMKSGLLPISIQVEDRFDYYERLDKYGVSRDLKPFTELIYELEEKRLNEIINIINQVQEAEEDGLKR